MRIFSNHISTKTLRKNCGEFGYPLLGYGILAVLLDSLDKVLVTRLISKEAGGIYSVGYRLGMVMRFSM
jgi:O-antigen/teichoic acid export membrane protein